MRWGRPHGATPPEELQRTSSVLHCGTNPSTSVRLFHVTLFQLLNAPSDPTPATVAIAVFCAERLIFALPLTLAALWLWGGQATKRCVVAATLAGLLALAAAQVFGLVMYVPRPFEAGVGHTLIAHVADSSFPSDHATVLAAVAAVLILASETRLAGAALAVLWLPMAWARVYVGVHFPSDLLGGAIVGVCSALGVQGVGGPIVDILAAGLARIYRVLASPLIERGWVR